MFDENGKTTRFTLMYKNNKVLSFGIVIIAFDMYMSGEMEIYDESLLPILMKKHPIIKDWYTYRCFSNMTINYNNIIYGLCGMPKKNGYRIYGAQLGLSLFSYGANLSDKYWLNPDEEYVFYGNMDEDSFADGQIIIPSTYEKTSFFHNPHVSNNFGEAMLLHNDNGIKIKDFRTPEICTDGCGKKRWILKDGKYFMQKRVFKPEYFQPQFMVKEFIPPFEIKQMMVRECDFPVWIIETECVTDKDTELISAYDIICSNLRQEDSFKLLKENLTFADSNIDAYNDLVDCLKQYTDNNLEKVKNFENFGFLYDSNKGKIIKPMIWSNPC